ncbi:MAG TPA: histidine kinase [Gammaproteobacteria bacterium]|nr:histidine kinase [Gammaproteobacteria bacterium]
MTHSAPFKLGHSNKTNWQDAIEDCLQQTGDSADSNLAFIYVTDGYAKDLGKILRQLKLKTGIPHWVGSVGTAINCTNVEYYDQPAMVMMMAHFAENSFKLFNHTEDSHHLIEPTTDNVMAGVRIALLHGDPRNGQIPQMLEQLPDQLGNGYLIGGITSSENQFFFQIADGITEGQLSGVVFNDDIPVISGLSQACSPIGQTHMLTDCDNHMAISIDNRPALDVFKEEIGEVLAKDVNRAAGYIFAAFPVRGSDTADYIVRNIIGIDPQNNMLAIGEQMKPQTPIMFCRRDGRAAIRDMQRMLKDLKKRAGNATPRGGIYISCMGRGRHLFGDDAREMKMISEVFGDIPIVGFYANGEIAGQRLYAYTGVLTLFL